MRGEEGVIKLRLIDKTPKVVFINDFPCKTDWFEYGEHATVCTFGDRLSSLDMRFVKDLAVSVSATSESRAKALSMACKDAGASVVIAVYVQSDKHALSQDGWAEEWRKEQPNG